MRAQNIEFITSIQSISCEYKICTFDNKVGMHKSINSFHVSFTHLNRTGPLGTLPRTHKFCCLRNTLTLEGFIGLKP